MFVDRLFPLLLTVAALQPATAHSRIEYGAIRSRTLRTDKSYAVYLPAGYDEGGGSYPVLYLLHGAYGCDRNWIEQGRLRQTADSLIELGAIPPVVIVLPDARGEGVDSAGKNMGYFDQSGWPYERFFFEEFLPEVERRYRIRRERSYRAVAGLSMGGGAAVAYAQRHPALFGAAASLSGLLDSFPAGCDPEAMTCAFLESVERTSPVRFLADADAPSLEALRRVRWYADCGTEDFLRPLNEAFRLRMSECGIPLIYRSRPGGHDWDFWRSGLEGVLRFAFASFPQDRSNQFVVAEEAEMEDQKVDHGD